MKARRRRTPGWYLRWAVIGVTAVVLLSFLVLLSGLPGFGYRSPRRGDAAFQGGEGPEDARVQLDPRRGLPTEPSAAARLATLRLYFPRRERPDRITPVEVEREAGEGIPGLVRACIRGLASPPPVAGLLPALPKETRVLTVFTEEGPDGTRVLLNLSPEVQEPRPGGVASSHGALYALANSLTSLPGVSRVKLLISSQEALTFREHHALEGDLRFHPGAVDESPLQSGAPEAGGVAAGGLAADLPDLALGDEAGPE